MKYIAVKVNNYNRDIRRTMTNQYGVTINIDKYSYKKRYKLSSLRLKRNK